jgi:hypothetical protein
MLFGYQAADAVTTPLTILNAILRDKQHGAQKPLDRQHSR